jgi:hypothetical protein
MLDEESLTNTGKLVRFSEVTPKLASVLSKVIFFRYAQEESQEALLHQPDVAVNVACPAVEVVTLDEESNLVLSDQLVCPLPPDQSVCVHGLEAA